MEINIITIIGARPQFIKHSILENKLIQNFNLKTIHTSQHYDYLMSDIFFQELGIKKPDYTLNTNKKKKKGSHLGSMIVDLEEIISSTTTDAILVYGDTRSTLAGALVANQLSIPLIHVEAGLRSYNNEMPEEINRKITDLLSQILLVPTYSSKENLLKENISKNIAVTGDIMKDLIIKARNEDFCKSPLEVGSYIYLTLHRPYNVDDKDRLLNILDTLNKLEKKIIFPVHPRTSKIISDGEIITNDFTNITFTNPKGYKENLNYLKFASHAITDSGGMQKEAYWLQTPCITIRPETEWIETLENDANFLVYDNLEIIKDYIRPKDIIWDQNLYGDGSTADKIIEAIKDYFII